MTSIIDGTRFARAAATHEAILAAAADLFRRRGYRFVSLRDIAAEAGISHPALLKHFAGKEQLLADVSRRFDASVHLSGMEEAVTGGLPFAEIARRQAAVPGYTAFFGALNGEACARSHPANAAMAERMAGLRAEARLAFERAAQDGALGAGRDPAHEAAQLTAGWLGLQMLEQYLPGRVDIPATLERQQALLAHPPGWRAPDDVRPEGQAPPAPALPAILLDEPEEAEPAEAAQAAEHAWGGNAGRAGYRAGRLRRARIVEDATALFAREGYGDTSLLDIAERVGVSKSALYHHFPSKDALLHAVLRERDHRIDTTVAVSPPRTAAEMLRGLAEGAAANEREQPGLIELYAVVSSEATPATHDAHAYFEQRFVAALTGFTVEFQAAADAGDLPAHRNPEHEALWLLALWDGLQYLWLHGRATDVAGELRTHLFDALPL